MPRSAILTAAALLWATLAGAQTLQVDKNNRSIAVTASDTATAEADLASVSVGFDTYAPDAETAYRRGSQLSNAIVDALQNAGVSDKSIESSTQNLSRTDFPYNPAPTPEERAQKAFTLAQSWSVHTSAADAAKILHAAVEAGANNSGAIQWDVTDHKSLEAKAAAKALVDAHAIAAQMAAGLGVTLGPLVYASNQAPERPVLPMDRMGFRAKDEAAVQPLAIRPQQVRESATVYAVFSVQ